MPMNQLNSLANVKTEKWVQPTSTGSGVLRLPSGYPEATLRLPGRSGAGWEERGAGGPPSSGNSTNQSAKARAITTNSNSNPVHEMARHVTIHRLSRVSAVPRRVGGGFGQQRGGWIPGSLTLSPFLCCEE